MVDDKKNKVRQHIIRGVFIFAAALLAIWALKLQLLDSSFRQKANATAIDKYTQYPARGLVYDRHGELLVYNDPMYDLLVTVNQVDPEMDTALFCRLLGITPETFEENINPDWSSGRYSRSVPFVFLDKISADRFAAFQENMYRFPGFSAQLRNARGYPHQNGAHLLGYIREVNRQEVERSEGVYVSGDYIGASGLEASYEQDLRGRKGIRYLLRDNLGRTVGSYQNGALDTPAVSGRDLISSIDLDLQRYGEWLMQNKIGGIVAVEPATGEILSMISSPSYDPHELTISNNNRGTAYTQLNTDTIKPFLNRAVMAQYPPGSLFKTIVALIGLQEGVWDLDETVKCSGGYAYRGRILTGCHDHPTCTSVSEAIKYSCNAYFVTMFREIIDKGSFYKPKKALDTFNDYLDQFGMGKPLGVDFPSEQKGNYPTSGYYGNLLYKGENWNSIWIRSLGIGQGELLTTNLQLVNMASIIANRGHYYVPHLIKGFHGSDEPIPARFRQRHDVDIDPAFFEPVIEGMAGAVEDGTARLAQIDSIAVCGKTGTAENPHGADHSIFFCFAPRDNPQIAVAVYVENAGWGSTFAAPIASLMIEQYLTGEIGPKRKWIEKRMVETDLIHADDEEEQP